MMIRWLLLFLCIFASPTALSAERLRGPIPATVVRVVDGDTLKVRAKIWIGQTINISVRLRGIDTPELSASCPLERRLAQKARQRLASLVKISKDSMPVTLRNISQGKYGGRVIAFVDNANGISVGDVLLKEDIARPYRRNKARKSWCEQVTAIDNKN
ncbi:MAG: thermonuclease family protein [Hyphomicrobiales bacterium]